MTITIEPIKSDFVANVSGIDLRKPLSVAEIDAIHQNMDHYAVLIFHQQALDNDQQVAFSQQLGRLQPAVGNNITAQKDRRLNADFSDVSNLDGRSQIFDRYDRARLFGFGNRLWHTDASFRAIPAKYSILSARIVPETGGNTEFADMRAAYEALDENTQQLIDDLVVEHSQLYSRGLLGFTDFTAEERKTFTPVRHRMVRTLASTGRKSLYLGAHAGEIISWPTPEARTFIFELMEHATQPAFVYIHQWQTHDLVIWDNRQVLHRVRRFDDLQQVRDMRRTTIMGNGDTLSNHLHLNGQ